MINNLLRMAHTFRFIAFLILVPGVVMGYIPYRILMASHKPIGIGYFNISGYLLLIAGGLLFLASVAAFFLYGKGTPAIWLLKPLKFLVGDEPKELVDKGIYRYSRNPMYLGVLGVLAGLALVNDSLSLLYYFITVFLVFNLVVLLLEEPRLKHLHGKKFDVYKKKVPRWFWKI